MLMKWMCDDVIKYERAERRVMRKSRREESSEWKMNYAAASKVFQYNFYDRIIRRNEWIRIMVVPWV